METKTMKRHDCLMNCIQWHLTQDIASLPSQKMRWEALLESMKSGRYGNPERQVVVIPNDDHELDIIDDYILDNLLALMKKNGRMLKNPSPKEMQNKKFNFVDDAKCELISGWKDMMVEKGKLASSAIIALDVLKLAEITGIDGELVAHQLYFQKYKQRFLKRKVFEKDYVLASRYLVVGPVEGE